MFTNSCSRFVRVPVIVRVKDQRGHADWQRSTQRRAVQWVTIIVLISSMCDVCFVSKVKPARFNYKDLSRWMTEFEILR